MRIPISLFRLLLLLALAAPALASDRVPGEQWMRYVDPQEAGFDADKLEAARATWESLPSSAFLVIADGAVVAAWGDTDRRFMCHSVRKSLLSALFGIYWDRGEMDLNQTLFDLGIDDTPDPLLEVERQARILDLLKARSGIFHPAAYAGRTDSAPRGSKGAGRYFAYNNWDFNTLATILIEETGDDVFEAFDEYFGGPLQMEDWRVSDGYYHYERDKSRFPAYPFRLSARDAARFGLLFTREGLWGDKRILSKHWVRRSSALYSIDDDVRGYGFMWWIYREPRFERHGMYAALGVGNQMIAALPESDLVIVNRANTYEGERTPDDALRDLIEEVLNARVGTPNKTPKLVPLETEPEPGVTEVPVESLMEFVGEWDYPPAYLGLPRRTSVSLHIGPGHLVGHSEISGTFKLYMQPDGSLLEEDSYDRYHIVRDPSGAFSGISDSGTLMGAALLASAEGKSPRSDELLALVGDEAGPRLGVARALVIHLTGKSARAEKALQELVQQHDPATIEAHVNSAGYQLLAADRAPAARKVLTLNTHLFPEAFNTWDSLAEVLVVLGEPEEAIHNYEKSLALNEENRSAAAAIERLRAETATED